MKKPELLLPAGSLDKMRAAYRFGADAVYAGQPRYSLRARNNEFSKLEILEQGIKEAHELGKQFFVASNLMPHNAKLKTYIQDIEPVIAMKPDALIMADPGLIMMVREKFPEIPVHLSVQANTVNYQAVKFWKALGLSRVILSRELSLDEIEEIRQECPDMELEVFVHGALCIAYSGRCLLSGYFNHRDANQGTCTNSCRWEYNVKSADEDATGDIYAVDSNTEQLKDFNFQEVNETPAFMDTGNCGQQKRHPLADKVYLISEVNRPNGLMPVLEDEHGTYIMNSKDLRAIEHVERLIKIGIDSLKVEGRTKSIYYVARTAQLYKMAIDDAMAGKPFNLNLLGALEGLANRGYTDGFYERHHTQDYQNYIQAHSDHTKQLFIGEVTSYDLNTQIAEIDVRNQVSNGDTIEIIHPNGNSFFQMENMVNRKDQPLETALGSGYVVKAKIPSQVDLTHAFLAKNLNAPAEA